MAEKKQNEGKDVFETALDYAIPIVSGIAGARFGGKALRKLLRHKKPQLLEKELLKTPVRKTPGPGMDYSTPKSRAAYERWGKAVEANMVGGIGSGILAGIGGYEVNKHRKKK